jgi:hypothetical protein
MIKNPEIYMILWNYSYYWVPYDFSCMNCSFHVLLCNNKNIYHHVVNGIWEIKYGFSWLYYYVIYEGNEQKNILNPSPDTGGHSRAAQQYDLCHGASNKQSCTDWF